MFSIKERVSVRKAKSGLLGITNRILIQLTFKFSFLGGSKKICLKQTIILLERIEK